MSGDWEDTSRGKGGFQPILCHRRRTISPLATACLSPLRHAKHSTIFWVQIQTRKVCSLRAIVMNRTAHIDYWRRSFASPRHILSETDLQKNSVILSWPLTVALLINVTRSDMVRTSMLMRRDHALLIAFAESTAFRRPSHSRLTSPWINYISLSIVILCMTSLPPIYPWKILWRGWAVQQESSMD